MEHVKVIVASEDNIVREPLMKYFSEWGMEALEFTKPLPLSTLTNLSPKLVFMEKNFYSYYDFLSESSNHLFEETNKPGMVIVVKPNDSMPLMQDVGQHGILKMPYTPLSLFNTVKQALFSNSMESCLGTVLAKLDIIYGMMTQEQNHSSQWTANDITKSKSEGMFSLEKELSQDNKCGIIPKSKMLIVSLLKEAKKNNQLRQYEGQLHLLDKYITELEHERLSHVEDPDLDPLLAPDLQKTHALSRKEVKVFAMITKNMTTDEIAEKLFISPETVKSHRRNIRKKLSLVGNKVTLSDFIHHLNDCDDGDAIDKHDCNKIENTEK